MEERDSLHPPQAPKLAQDSAGRAPGVGVPFCAERAPAVSAGLMSGWVGGFLPGGVGSSLGGWAPPWMGGLLPG